MINYLHFVIFGLVVRNFFVALLLNKKFDGISNELGMFLDNFFDFFLLIILNLILFQVENNFGTTSNGFTFSISFDSERTTGRRLPNVLKTWIIWMLKSRYIEWGQYEGTIENLPVSFKRKILSFIR